MRGDPRDSPRTAQIHTMNFLSSVSWNFKIATSSMFNMLPLKPMISCPVFFVLGLKWFRCNLAFSKVNLKVITISFCVVTIHGPLGNGTHLKVRKRGGDDVLELPEDAELVFPIPACRLA